MVDTSTEGFDGRIPWESLDEKLTFRQSRRGPPGPAWTHGAAEQCLTPQETWLYLTSKITSLKGSEGQGQIREKTGDKAAGNKGARLIGMRCR